MKMQRRSSGEIMMAIAGSLLLLAGIIRFAQGRPTGSIVTQPPVVNATTAQTMAAGVSADQAVGHAVDIADFTYSPDPLSVAVGAKVIFTNRDSFAHTATSKDGKGFDTGRIETGQTFSTTFDTAGTFTYKCSIHNSMTGTIEVK